MNRRRARMEMRKWKGVDSDGIFGIVLVIFWGREWGGFWNRGGRMSGERN